MPTMKAFSSTTSVESQTVPSPGGSSGPWLGDLEDEGKQGGTIEWMLGRREQSMLRGVISPPQLRKASGSAERVEDTWQKV